jgi:hypothetical protein
MINQYEDFFTLIDSDKIQKLVHYYQMATHDRKMISTWKNFYEDDSEMMSYIRFYNEASDALLNKVNLCLQNYNENRKDILGMMDVDSEGDITQVVDKIRSTASDIDEIYIKVSGEFEDLGKLFWNIWQIYDDEFKIPPLPKIPEPFVKKGKE